MEVPAELLVRHRRADVATSDSLTPTYPSKTPTARSRLLSLLMRWPTSRYLFMGDVIAFILVGFLSPSLPSQQVIVLPIILASFYMSGLYRSRLNLSLLDDIPYIAKGLVVGFLSAVAINTATDSGNERDLLQWMLLLPVLSLIRFIAYFAVRSTRRNGYSRNGTIIVGAGRVGIDLAQKINAHSQYGLDAVGFIDDNPWVTHPSELPAPILGGYKEIAGVIQAFNARQVIVAFGSMREAQLVDVLRTCDRLRCELFFVPRLFEINATTRDMEEIWGVPLVRVRRGPYRQFAWRVKRLMDIMISAVTIVLLAPLLAACALAVRLESGPGILFRQERVGLDERSFTLLKFRSLKPTNDIESSTRWSIAEESSRIGPVGRFLRRTSLDELPQLWNVLAGDMSLVGPRPERPYFVEQFHSHIPRYLSRHRVPAGITGHAQVHGLRGDTSIEERAVFDNYYIENWSLWSDVKIMARTLAQVVRQRGA